MIGIQTYAWAGVNMAADHSVRRGCDDVMSLTLHFSGCFSAGVILVDQAFIVKRVNIDLVTQRKRNRVRAEVKTMKTSVT